MKQSDGGKTDPCGAGSAEARRQSPGEDGIGAWRRQLGELALACAGSFPGEEIHRLRDMRGLLAAAPAPAMLCGLAVPSAERLDQLVAAEAPATLALELLGADWGYLLSRGASGQHLASVILPGAAEEISASGDTLALALIGALGLALVDATLADSPALPAGPALANSPASPERPTRNRARRLN